jgi:hypothetical protein
MRTRVQRANRRCAASVLIALGSEDIKPTDVKVVELNDYEVIFLRQHLKAYISPKEGQADEK